jgi:hypothetical protein
VTRDLAIPLTVMVVKTIATRAAPTAAKFVVRQGAKYLLPFAVRLSVL